jgi:hypothetical protein
MCFLKLNPTGLMVAAEWALAGDVLAVIISCLSSAQFDNAVGSPGQDDGNFDVLDVH